MHLNIILLVAFLEYKLGNLCVPNKKHKYCFTENTTSRLLLLAWMTCLTIGKTINVETLQYIFLKIFPFFWGITYYIEGESKNRNKILFKAIAWPYNLNNYQHFLILPLFNNCFCVKLVALKVTIYCIFIFILSKYIQFLKILI